MKVTDWDTKQRILDEMCLFPNEDNVLLATCEEFNRRTQPAVEMRTTRYGPEPYYKLENCSAKIQRRTIGTAVKETESNRTTTSIVAGARGNLVRQDPHRVPL